MARHIKPNHETNLNYALHTLFSPNIHGYRIKKYTKKMFHFHFSLHKLFTNATFAGTHSTAHTRRKLSQTINNFSPLANFNRVSCKVNINSTNDTFLPHCASQFRSLRSRYTAHSKFLSRKIAHSCMKQCMLLHFACDTEFQFFFCF
jgi:hypothetical protein